MDKFKIVTNRLLFKDNRKDDDTLATVPGAPTLVSAVDIGSGGPIQLDITAPTDDGGSPLLAYRVYIDGDLETTLPLVGIVPAAFLVDGDFFGLQVEVSAVNAIGEGPRSEPFIVTKAGITIRQIIPAGASDAFPGEGSYGGGFLLPDGKVFCVPSNALEARVYDPATDSVSIVGEQNSFPGNLAYADGVQLPNGDVVCVPFRATQARRYNFETGAVSVIGNANDFPGNESYFGGTLLPNGRVFFSPFRASRPRIYNPQLNTVQPILSAETLPGNFAFAGCVHLEDGNVFLVPFLSPQAVVVNGIFDGALPVGSSTSFPGGGAYSGGVKLADGRIFCVPFNATEARVYDPANNSVSVVGGLNSFPGPRGFLREGSIFLDGAYIGGVLLPDGSVFCVPYSATQPRIYNPETNTVSLIGEPDSFPEDLGHAGGVLLSNGDVFCVPFAATQARIYR